jgi:glucosamine-6-phosphate isomerase
MSLIHALILTKNNQRRMDIRIYKDYTAMSEAAAAFMISLIKSIARPKVCVASGDTPTATLQRLVDLKTKGAVDFSDAHFIGLDEWVGMDKNDRGSCSQYVYSNFFDPAGISEKQITFFDAKAQDLQKECDRVNQYLKTNGPLDVVLVGVGMNGHIGLNEPGVAPDLDSHVVDLEKSTREVAQKYFSEKTTVEKGITLGLGTIMKAKTVIVIASGEKKSSIIQKLVEGPISVDVPGTILRQHSSCYFLLDEAAASRLTLSA